MSSDPNKKDPQAEVVIAVGLGGIIWLCSGFILTLLLDYC